MATKAKSPRGRGRGRGKSPIKAADSENGDVPELDAPPLPTMTTPKRTSLRLNSSSLASDEGDDISEVPVESKGKEKEESNGASLLEDLDAVTGNDADVGGDSFVDALVRESVPDATEVAVEENLPGADIAAAVDAEVTAPPTVIPADVEPISDSTSDEKMDISEISEIDETIEKAEENAEKPEATVEDAEMVSEDELLPEAKEPLETEAVSDDELKEESQGMPDTEAVSDDELPEDKRKKAKVAEAEAVSEDELPDDVVKKPKDVADDTKSEEGKNEKKRKLVEGDYDPSSPTSENSNDGSPAPKKAAVSDSKEAPQPPGKKPLPELEKYWKAVKDDASDFTGWTYLLQYVDQENDIEVAREAYDSFLAHYPYCYGYWRKYADYEKRKGNSEECERVFERGLKAIPLSVDLWLHYLNYIKAAYVEDKEFVRAQYDRAIEACGLEFRSDRLWENYIKWEKEGKNLINITNIYDKLLAVPTQGYTSHFDSFQEHINGNAPQTVLPVDDFLEVRREVVAEMKQNEKTVTAVPDDDAPPGEEVDPDKEGESSVANSTARMEEETNLLREKILAARRKIHKATVTAVAARWNFEEGIKRPYFHVKPLERCQLKNWKDYLEYEIEQGDMQRVVILFERGLIACALYEEFWVRFVRYLESLPGDQSAKVRDVYERACTIHHKKKPNLHLQWSVFEESCGNYDKAASILENVEATLPNILQIAYRRINLERRRGAFDRACTLYEEYIAANKTRGQIASNMTVKYARFVWKFMNDIDKSIEILEKALERDKENTRMYLQLIDMGLQRNPVDENRIVAILDQFLDKEGDIDQKVMFAQRKIEFLEDFGSNIEKVQKAQDEFQKYLKQVKEKKKKESDSPAPPSAPPTPSSKKAKTDASSAGGPPMPNAPPPANPPSNYGNSAGGQAGYPPNYYGQYPPPSGDQSYPNNYHGYPNNYPNWNQYQPNNYGNYSSQWPGYYPNY